LFVRVVANTHMTASTHTVGSVQRTHSLSLQDRSALRLCPGWEQWFGAKQTVEFI